jgi:hypothetical protein
MACKGDDATMTTLDRSKVVASSLIPPAKTLTLTLYATSVVLFTAWQANHHRTMYPSNHGPKRRVLAFPTFP